MENNEILHLGDTTNRIESPEHAGELICYVAEGGGLVVEGAALEAFDKFGLGHLIGARTICRLSLREWQIKVGEEGLLNTTIQAKQSVQAALYLCHFDTLRPGREIPRRSIVMEYRYCQTVIPALWTLRYGMGNVVVLNGMKISDIIDVAVREIVDQTIRRMEGSV